ncbi:MAG: DUF2452 domain-containing protein [Thiocapsa sp.]|jgi:hypothetical protein|uniref:DUF2452 domain-containing protein n=1 Tax=Thiocapsa sp. TaxID=2024551 RepID=UPI001BCBA131|nr:DUF2452 domain-containing protein [Thiocapsa sp.]QVL50357.1 MAG: DUF2452 domain-containing protein [Thiocapsa sp.]
MSNDDKGMLHRGGAHSSPYPVSRLAPAFDSGELASEVARAESMLSARTGAKLRVIADQIKLLQQEARKVLADAKEEQTLTRAQCAFKRIPGRTYHLYCKTVGEPFFSMLAPAEWGGEIPYAFLGSYRLETDYSWTPADRADRPDDTGELVTQLLRIGGLASRGEG